MSFRLLKNLLKNPEVRLWRRAQFCLGQSDFIIREGARDVCEGDHSLNVMNQWGALTMKIRCRRFGESRDSLRGWTGLPRIGSQNPRPVSAKNADTRAGHLS